MFKNTKLYLIINVIIIMSYYIIGIIVFYEGAENAHTKSTHRIYIEETTDISKDDLEKASKDFGVDFIKVENEREFYVISNENDYSYLENESYLTGKSTILKDINTYNGEWIIVLNKANIDNIKDKIPSKNITYFVKNESKIYQSLYVVSMVTVIIFLLIIFIYDLLNKIKKKTKYFANLKLSGQSNFLIILNELKKIFIISITSILISTIIILFSDVYFDLLISIYILHMSIILFINIFFIILYYRFLNVSIVFLIKGKTKIINFSNFFFIVKMIISSASIILICFISSLAYDSVREYVILKNTYDPISEYGYLNSGMDINEMNFDKYNEAMKNLKSDIFENNNNNYIFYEIINYDKNNIQSVRTNSEFLDYYFPDSKPGTIYVPENYNKTNLDYIIDSENTTCPSYDIKNYSQEINLPNNNFENTIDKYINNAVIINVPKKCIDFNILGGVNSNTLIKMNDEINSLLLSEDYLRYIRDFELITTGIDKIYVSYLFLIIILIITLIILVVSNLLFINLYIKEYFYYNKKKFIIQYIGGINFRMTFKTQIVVSLIVSLFLVILSMLILKSIFNINFNGFIILLVILFIVYQTIEIKVLKDIFDKNINKNINLVLKGELWLSYVI